MAIPESVSEQIMVALQAQVQAVMVAEAEGGACWYTCDAYLRPPNWQLVDYNNIQRDDGLPVTTLVCARHGAHTLEENPSETLDQVMMVHLLACTRYTTESNNILQQTLLEQTVQNRLVHDLLFSVFQDVTLGLPNDEGGGPADNAEVVEVDRQTYAYEGWAIVEVTLRIRFGPTAEEP